MSVEFRKELFANERDDNLNEIGKGTQRQDALGHVTGRSPYFDDHLFEGLLTDPLCAQPAPSRQDPVGGLFPGREYARRGADHPSGRCAEQLQYPVEPFKFRPR